MSENVFSQQLIKFRKEKGITQEKLADYIGVTPQAVSKWENGSYPDCELLPKIADFLEVSIDRLFGKGGENRCLEEKLMDELQATKEEDKFDRMLDFCWAMNIAGWDEVKNYWKPDNKISAETYGGFFNNNGLSLIRLNDTLQYFWCIKEPKDGYSSFLKIDEKNLKLFEVLSKRKNQELLFFIYSNAKTSFITKNLISEKLNIPIKQVEQMISDMKEVSLLSDSTLSNGNGDERIICMRMNYAVIMFLAIAYSIVEPPNCWQVQNDRTQWDKCFFKKDHLDFLIDK